MSAAQHDESFGVVASRVYWPDEVQQLVAKIKLPRHLLSKLDAKVREGKGVPLSGENRGIYRARVEKHWRVFYEERFDGEGRIERVILWAAKKVDGLYDVDVRAQSPVELP